MPARRPDIDAILAARPIRHRTGEPLDKLETQRAANMAIALLKRKHVHDYYALLDECREKVRKQRKARAAQARRAAS